MPNIFEPTLPTINLQDLPLSQARSLYQPDPKKKPTVVLPHSEPLSEEQCLELQPLIALFSQPLITCLHSTQWSARSAAISKLYEQLQNLDPQERDALSCEVNRQNLQPHESFPLFIRVVEHMLKDPVLKNYL